jgi:hypothetical protein
MAKGNNIYYQIKGKLNFKISIFEKQVTKLWAGLSQLRIRSCGLLRENINAT